MTQKTESNKDIIIDLDLTDNNASLDAQQLVQHACYVSLKNKISADLAKADLESTKKERSGLTSGYPYGSGLVYFIDGTRGAGKSTFLRSTYNALPKELQSVESLAYIDPSRIERSEVILLSILKALKVQIHTLSKSANTLDGEHLNKSFREAFKKLAGGLSLFAKSHDQLQDLDAELFFEWGLERAGHSADLRKNLHALLDITCTALDVNALVLAFDDADTNSQHANNVLECIRKYLDTPRLVILVTGDIELYSLMVRDHFYESLGEAKHDQTPERREQRNKMVDHLEDQYLLKLFPMHRRLQLRPLWNLLKSDSDRYKLSHSNWGNHSKRDPEVVIDELVQQGLRIKTPRDLELYREYLLKQPLRSILQVLCRCVPFLATEVTNEHQSYAWNKDLSEALSESLRALALGSLYKFGVDVDAISAHELPALTKAVFDLAVRDGDFDTAAYLRPQPSNADLKNSFAALSADVTRLCAEKPAALIDYMLAAPGSVALYGQVLRRKGKDLRTGDDAQALRQQFEQYMGIGRKEDALNWARHAVTILSAPYGANPSRAVVYAGIIGLNKGKPDQAPKEAESQYKTCLSVLKSSKDLPAFALSLVDVSGTASRTYASIYNILGLMGRLLALEPDNTKNYPVLSVLPKPYPPLSVSRPQWENDAAEEEDSEQDATDDSAKLATLERAVNQWLHDTSTLRTKLNPSAVLIGKIWTRLYFSLEKVCDANRPKVSQDGVGAASLMELFALCVINAFFVEEQDYHLSSASESIGIGSALDRTNPLTSAKVFIEKFKSIKDNHKELPLTYLVATCPLLLGLLQATPHTKNFVAELIKCNKLAHPETEEDKEANSKAISANLLCDESAWKKLNRTYIAGTKWKKEPEERTDQEESPSP